MITIGGHFGGPEHHNSELWHTHGAVGNAIFSCRNGWEPGDSPGVNVVFYYPGSICAHSHMNGLKLERYSRREKLVLVTQLVPAELVRTGVPASFMLDAIRRACEIAADVFRSKSGGDFDLTKAIAIVDCAERSLQAEGR